MDELTASLLSLSVTAPAATITHAEPAVSAAAAPSASLTIIPAEPAISDKKRAIEIVQSEPIQELLKALNAEIVKLSSSKDLHKYIIKECEKVLSSLSKKETKKITKGGNSLAKGLAYEDIIRRRLQSCTFNGEELIVKEETAGAGHGHDISFQVSGHTVNVECKDKGAFEGGGKVFKNVENKLVIIDECFHKTLVGDYIPFEGKIPSFLKGDKSIEMWESEKKDFKDEYIEVLPSVVTNYYKSKGIHYIQVEGKGLYTTGLDILELGVPLFACSTEIRIRCKRHGSTSMPSSVQASFVYDKKTLHRSSFDFQTTLPPKFM